MWAGISLAILTGNYWGIQSIALSVLCMVGVLLVCRPSWISFLAADDDDGQNTWYGEVSAILFGVTNGFASALIGVHEIGTHSIVVTMTYFMHGSLVVGIIAAVICGEVGLSC